MCIEMLNLNYYLMNRALQRLYLIYCMVDLIYKCELNRKYQPSLVRLLQAKGCNFCVSYFF